MSPVAVLEWGPFCRSAQTLREAPSKASHYIDIKLPPKGRSSRDTDRKLEGSCWLKCPSAALIIKPLGKL